MFASILPPVCRVHLFAFLFQVVDYARLSVCVCVSVCASHTSSIGGAARAVVMLVA